MKDSADRLRESSGSISYFDAVETCCAWLRCAEVAGTKDFAIWCEALGAVDRRELTAMDLAHRSFNSLSAYFLKQFSAYELVF